MKKLITAAALAAAALTLPAGAALASAPHLHTTHAAAFAGPTFTASTQLTAHPDSGGGGTWAYDSATRVLSITETGSSDGVYSYTATVTDNAASFTAIDGALTPNQGLPFTGETITGSPSGSFSGSASYSFTASALPAQAHNLGVPASESGAPVTPAETTSLWYEQAFPAGTTFGGSGIGDWGWTYTARIQTGLFGYVTQTWADTSSDGDGQIAADGNIEGA